MKIFILGTILKELFVICFPTIITDICFNTSFLSHQHFLLLPEIISLGYYITVKFVKIIAKIIKTTVTHYAAFVVCYRVPSSYRLDSKRVTPCETRHPGMDYSCCLESNTTGVVRLQNSEVYSLRLYREEGFHFQT